MRIFRARSVDLFRGWNVTDRVSKGFKPDEHGNYAVNDMRVILRRMDAKIAAANWRV